MNWYKIAQEKPQTVSSLTSIEVAWIDPQGMIYDALPSHSDWIKDNFNFLKKNYNVQLEDVPTSNVRFEYNKGRLTMSGWIRFLYEYPSLLFDINDFSNTKAIYIIEKELKKMLNPDAKNDILIWAEENGNTSAFSWREYVESEDDFTHFVFRNINYRK